MNPSVLFVNGIIWAGTPPEPSKSWLYVKGGRIEVLGTGAEPQADEIRDLTGHQVLPGFVDAHSHLSLGAWLPFALDASPWRSHETALAELRRARAVRTDDWLLALSSNLDMWADGMPKLRDLDQACGNRPALIMDFTYHRALVSSAGIARLGLGTQTHKGDVERRWGRVTGQLWERAAGAALHIALCELAAQMSERGWLDLLMAEATHHLSLGITACHDPLIPPSLQPLMERLAAATPLRVSWSRVAEKGLLSPADSAELCPNCGSGPASAKLFMDGGHKCAMCFDPSHVLQMTGDALRKAVGGNVRPLRMMFREPGIYRAGKFYTPHLQFDAPALIAKLDELATHNVRPRIHAFGNHAATCACGALVAAGRPAATLEHLIYLSEADKDAIANSGAVASVQPALIPKFGLDFLETKVAPRLTFLPAASLRRRGVPVALSSDYPVASLDPLHNIRAAVTRRLANGEVTDANEALSLEEAVEGYTTLGYRAIQGDGGQGLSPGACADLAVVNGSILEPASRVVETWVGGQIAWSLNRTL